MSEMPTTGVEGHREERHRERGQGGIGSWNLPGHFEIEQGLCTLPRLKSPNTLDIYLFSQKIKYQHKESQRFSYLNIWSLNLLPH